ncbi:MarR family transcriptional regulator [Companilactobacillus allii]|uniref:MarR family transcriptional regulator n=1 Tax=Companilactobacillus allii TaxID=1847728 RepID=A0A1P8Q4E4_9LACO|nr:MarR family transcriptional regulator [Companilactobacillus allii]APX72732.1 MarR family transcriptional regulator [Companilactobacillus allii]USQ67517.1 MarR family transcriptional regulator [Companilactobacillus allii]
MEDVLRTIGTIARALDSIANIEFVDIDLTRGQYLYLARICEQPGIIQEQLANQLNVDRATVARSVQKLEKKNIITRQNDAKNLRIKHLLPTEKGRSVYKTVKRENDYSTKIAVDGMTDSEILELSKLLNKMKKNINHSWKYVKDGNKREY